MSTYRPKHPVQPPAVPSRAQCEDTSGIIATLYTIEPVCICTVFDEPSPADVLTLENPRSSALFELLAHANLRRGTVVLLEIRGKAVSGAALARLNWFLHIHGHTRGFRAWKIARRDKDGGLALWKCAAAWTEFKQLLRL